MKEKLASTRRGPGRPQHKQKMGASRTHRSGPGARSCLSLIAASAPAQSALGVAAAAAAALSDGKGEGEGEKSHEQAGEALRAAPMSAVLEICNSPPDPSRGKVLGVPQSARLSTHDQHLDNLLLRACSIKEENEHLCLRRARNQRGPWACEGGNGRVKQKAPLALTGSHGNPQCLAAEFTPEFTLRQSSVPGGRIHAVNLERKVALGIGFKKTTLAVPEKTTSLASEHALYSVGAVAAATAAGDNARRFGPQKAPKRSMTSRSAVTSRGDSLDFFACTFGPILDEPAGLGSDQDCEVVSALHNRGLVTRQRCATTFLPSSLDGVVCPTPPHRRCRGCASPNGTQRESPTLPFILIV